jgi:dTDP-4-amino-4,6-dideoxy-D-glucose ammonia-lyase
MEAAINGTYKYPHRINLFPGTSCMFKCSFCGRNYGARDPNYNYFYDTLLDQDPQDDPYRFNVSGGLEPLTYSDIDRLCKDLNDRGFKSRLVTNGFLLTPINIERKPHLLTLDHIRVSLYGYNKQQTILTTKHEKSYNVVKQNLTDYNKLKTKPPLHINHVILPTDFENLNDILNYIDDIGGVDTLSLREDFSFKYPINDRNRLMDLILEFDEKINSRTLKVDYGYALQQLLEGKQAELIRVDYTQLTETQSPQVKIAIDPRGDIYSYFEAAFIDRKHSERHILGNVINSSIEEQLSTVKKIKPHKDDVHFLDAFNYVIEAYKWMKSQETYQ